MADDLGFDWDAANLEHIALHAVTAEEVEEVFANDPVDVDFRMVDGEERYAAVGHTNGLRILVVAWTMREESLRVVTAFEASARMAKQYLAGKGF